MMAAKSSVNENKVYAMNLKKPKLIAAKSGRGQKNPKILGIAAGVR